MVSYFPSQNQDLSLRALETEFLFSSDLSNFLGRIFQWKRPLHQHHHHAKTKNMPIDHVVCLHKTYLPVVL